MFNSIPLSDMLFFDVETVSVERNFEALDEEGRQLWAHKTSYLQAQQGLEPAALYERAAIYAEFGKVVCISAGFLHGAGEQLQLRLKSFYGTDEAGLLREFASVVEQWGKRHAYLCGHNIREFDLPFLCRRMLVNQIPLPPLMDVSGAKPWEVRHLDTLQYWKFGDYKHYSSLRLLAWLFGIPGPKTDMDGSKVGQVYYEQGDVQRIARYCELDVITVVRLMQAMRGVPVLSDAQIVSHLSNDRAQAA